MFLNSSVGKEVSEDEIPVTGFVTFVYEKNCGWVVFSKYIRMTEKLALIL